ncbi:AsmA family protein [Albibacterium bauzanense]|uniref:AsmA-like protein n=1 Tax=Albibacterium bauzanense TaxID=653929 RepID=A0A4R1LZT9_9SPHI|nr:hypothetical protein [Albibacterium bauzanense]TCK82769.1 hypothetical protein C8N28_1354 [Albibacterium bauzanense]
MGKNHSDQVKSTKTNWKRILIWTAAVTGFIILLLIIGGFILQNRLPENLKNRIRTESKGVYELKFDRMNVSLLNGSIRLNNVQLLPDTTAYFHLDSAQRASKLFKLKATSLDISGLGFLKLFFKKNIQVSSITLNRPDLIVMNMHDTVKVDSNVNKTMYEQMPSLLKDARVQVFRVNGLSYVQQEMGDTTKQSGKWSNLSFAMESVSIDSLSQKDSTAFWFCKDIQVNSRKVQFASNDGMYKYTIGEIKASVKRKALDILDFKVIPQYPEMEFSQRLGEEGDRYQLVVQRINAKEVDFKQLELSGRLHVLALDLENAELRVFHNKMMPPSGKIKTGNFPNIAIKRLKIPLVLDTMYVKNFDVYYKELSRQSEKAGTAFFTNIYGTLHNVTNDTLQWKKDPWCRTTFQTNFLGKTKLMVDINLNMEDKDGEFNYKGSLAKSDAKLYNELLVPMAMARIEEGTIQEVTFNVNANSYGSTAHVQLLYDNLKVNLLGKDGNVLKKKGFLSFLANSFIIKNSNPRKKGEAPINADISYIHDRERSFFNLMWKSIFMGMKVNLGVPEL